MLKRDYQAPEFNVRDEREVRGGQVAGADTRTAAPITFGDESWRDRMLEQLGRQGSAILDKAADIEFSSLYLEGQAKAGMIESEDELEGNPLTRDWKVAGYRDTMGKLALADSEAQFSVDISKLREKGPEELQAYLAQRRDKMLPAMSGMSREARAAAAGQLLLQDRAAIKSYTTEHTKFIIEEKSKAIQAQANTSLRMLGAAQAKFRMGDVNRDDFTRQLESTAGTMVGSVWEDRSLPGDVKQNLTFEMVQMALANDSVELYDFLAQSEIPDGEGGASTLLSRLDSKQQQQLANSYRESKSRTNGARNLYQMEQIANIESQIDSDMFKGEYSDLTEMLNPMVVAGTIPVTRRDSILKSFLDKQYKAEESSTIFSAALNGDTHALFLAGKSHKDGVDAIEAGLAKQGATPEKRLRTHLQAGSNGLSGSFKVVGEILGSSLRQIRTDKGEILPQHAETFRTINDAVRTAEAKGDRNARMQVLSGLSEDDRMFATRVFAHVDGDAPGTGKTLDEAIALASDAEVKEAAMSPSARAALAQTSAQEINNAIKEIEPSNWLEYSWTYVKSIFSEEARADRALNVESDVSFRDGLWGDRAAVRRYSETVASEVQEEAYRVMGVNPTAKIDSVILTAKANVAARTVQSRHGPIILPHRTDAAAVFGVSPANLSKVGPALDKMLQETKADARWHIQFHNGKVFAQELDRNGVGIGNGDYLNPKDVRTAVQGLMEAEADEANARAGTGRKIKQDGLTLNYSGANNLGVSRAWMLDLRDNLVQNEGVKATPYKDQTGKKDKAGNVIETVGVGVTSTNPHYPKRNADGSIDPYQIQLSFLRASHDAAKAGYKVARDVGVDNKHGFSLMGELAYQSGVNFLTQPGKTGDRYRAFAQALQTKDAAAAQAAFKQTAAWYWSADRENPEKVTARQKHYLQLIEKSTQGG